MRIESGEQTARVEPTPAAKGMLFSPEFRWLYLLVSVVLLLLSMALLAIGVQSLVDWRAIGSKASDFLARGILYSVGSLVPIILAVAIQQARRYFLRVYETTIEEIRSVELGNIKEGDFERFEEIKQIRRAKDQSDFERNLATPFIVRSLEIEGLDFFGTCRWNLRPGVNVLLGRNGYGKSLVLRMMAALLQRNEDASRDLAASTAGGQGYAQLSVERGDGLVRIRRETQRFTESPGKIPILAIPDSRFVSRADTAIEAPKDDALDLRADGARHFLDGLPYGEMMRALFNELCFDFYEKNRSFDQPGFEILRGAIQELTGDTFEFHSVERVGRNAFRLMVVTEGNETPVPIQYVSQGTLSVLGVVGIIRSYLKSLSPGAPEHEMLARPAIVLIDELDAHLHPLWQQRLTGMLRRNFPNVQFVLTAHSPLVVAGCWVGEAAVLRKGSDGFVIEQLERDFLATPVDEIYKVIFGVESLDEGYLQSASRATSGFSHQERISELEKKPDPTELERFELPRLIREENMINRAAELRVERVSDRDRIFELEAKIESLEDQLKQQAGSA